MSDEHSTAPNFKTFNYNVSLVQGTRASGCATASVSLPRDSVVPSRASARRLANLVR